VAEDIDTLWARVATRSHPARRELVPVLRQFLASLKNPHAALLSGKPPEGATDGASAGGLEAMVIAQFRTHKLSKLEAADWMRLLYDVQKEIKGSGIELTLTRLADVLPPQPSPFAPQPMAISQRVEHWRRALHHWIEHSSPETARADWQAVICLSAVLHGALLDSTTIKALLERMHRNERLIIASSFGYMDFNLPFQGLGNHHIHRWFPDPLTDMLLARLPHDGEDLSLSRLASAFKKLLCAHGVKKADSPTGLADLVDSAATWWSQHAAQIDIQGARRKFTTHSIHPRSWARLHRLKVSDRRLKKERSGDAAAQSYLPEDEAGMIEDVLLLHPWLGESIGLLDGTPHASVREGVSCLMQKSANTPLATVYLGWLDFMLAGNSASRDGMKLSTIRRLFFVTAPRLILELGDTNPVELDTPELEDHYAEMTVEVDPGAPIRDIATGLREFHTYLVRMHGKPHISNISMVLGDDARLLPVDANLISFDDYLAAQKWFDIKLAEGRDPDDICVCKLVMAMAFRLGMRRMEILGLRLEDIQMEGGMVCLIRHHAGRRLKTDNAKRLIPMQAFFDWRERKLFRQWFARRRAEEERKCLPPGSLRSHYLFAIVDAKHPQERVSVEGSVDRITEALRAVTGDRRLYLHHLRHSFGSWTYLRLRAPDYPLIETMFGHLPATASAIKASARLRRLLLGSARSPSRVFAYAVARLLGHSSPAISMGHYVHVGDVILAAIVQREIAQVPRPVLVAASGLPQATAYAQLKKESEHSLAVLVRNRYQPAVIVDVEVTPTDKLPGRPVKTAPHLRADWLALDRV
jgi:integrase